MAAPASQTRNMYRVGDYVFMESNSEGPYSIRRIEELVKNSNGNVEARVTCFFRRRDIEKGLLKIADQAERKFEEYYEMDKEPESFHPGTGHTVANGEGVKQEVESEHGGSVAVGGEGTPAPENGGLHGKTAPLELNAEDDLMREWGNAGLPLGAEKLEGVNRHLFRHRELFLSRHQETVPCSSIRGRCLVTLLNEVEDLECYDREDTFFYSLVYDPAQLTLLADKGAIRVGEKYQAEVPDALIKEEPKEEIIEKTPTTPTPDPDENKENGDQLMIADEDASLSPSPAPCDTTPRERLVFHPHHSLSDQEIDQFLIIARAVGTFSRALDTNTSQRFPTLHMTAAAASRDVTIFHAMALLHQAKYDLGQGVRYLCPPCNKETYPFDAEAATGFHTASLGGPILCRDQLEEWSTAESNLFEEAMEKYGKDFHEMRNDYLPWKSVRDLVEYYYMWKTTNRYQDQKKQKHAEAENKLKQVYIPSYNKPNPNLILPPNPNGTLVKASKQCESCECEESSAWYQWGPPSASLRLCHECFYSWKKLGTVNKPHIHDTFDLKEPEREVAAQAALANADKTASTRAPPMTRPVVGQVVARLPSSHPAVQASRATAEAGGSVNAQIAAAHAAQVALKRGTNPEAVLNLSVPLTGLGSSKSASAEARAAAAANKARNGFVLNTGLITKVARRVAPKQLLNLKKSARRPVETINQPSIRQNMLGLDPNVLLRTAQAIRGSKLSASFVQGIANQTLLGSSGATKRPASAADMAGPAAKKSAPIPPVSAAAALAAVLPSGVSGASLNLLGMALPAGISLPAGLLQATALAAIPPPLAGTSRASPHPPAASSSIFPTSIAPPDAQPHFDSRWQTASNQRLVFVAGPKLKQLRRAVHPGRRDVSALARRPFRVSRVLPVTLPHLRRLLPPGFAAFVTT